jgi:hypothetical protein
VCGKRYLSSWSVRVSLEDETASKSSGNRCSDLRPLKTKKPFVVTIMSPRSRVESENASSDARRACSSTVGQTGFGGLGLRSKASRRTRERSDATCCCQICGVHSVEIGLSRTGLSCNDDLAIAAEPAGVAVCTCARTAVSATIATTAQTFKRSLTAVSLAIARIKFGSDEAGNSGTDYRARNARCARSRSRIALMAQRRRRSLRRVQNTDIQKTRTRPMRLTASCAFRLPLSACHQKAEGQVQ